MAGPTVSVGGWEHRGLYFAMESDWGTKIVSEEVSIWHKIRDEGFMVPDETKTRETAIVGDGRPGPDQAYVTTGPSTMPAMSTTHPWTEKNGSWLFGSLANGNGLSTDTAFGRHVTNDPRFHATLLALLKSGGKAYYGVSCNVSQVDVTIPPSEGGATGGKCTLAGTWIGQTGSGNQTSIAPNATLADDDDGSQLLTKDMTFKTNDVGSGPAEKVGFISGNLSFVNGYTLNPIASPSGLALGASYGVSGVTGSLVFSDATSGDANAEMRAAYDANTHTMLEFYWGAAHFLRVPAFIGKPTRSEVAGIVAWTYPFTYAEDSSLTEADLDGYAWSYKNSEAAGGPFDYDA